MLVHDNLSHITKNLSMQQAIFSVLTTVLALPTLTNSQLVVPFVAPSSDYFNMADNQQQQSVAITDIIGSNRAITTFSSFTRLHESTSSLLSDDSHRTTVLAPLNSAIEALGHKPWERSASDAEAGTYSGEQGRERANDNLRAFVEAHLVVANPWGKDTKAKTLAGREVWWTEKDGKRIVMPDEVEVDKVGTKVSNGEVWTLKGVLKIE